MLATVFGLSMAVRRQNGNPDGCGYTGIAVAYRRHCDTKGSDASCIIRMRPNHRVQLTGDALASKILLSVSRTAYSRESCRQLTR